MLVMPTKKAYVKMIGNRRLQSFNLMIYRVVDFFLNRSRDFMSFMFSRR